MKLSSQIRSLKNLYAFEYNNALIVSLNDFVTLLKSSASPGDKTVRKSNIEREIRGYTNEPIFINGSFHFTLHCLVQYCFTHCNDFSVASIICKEILSTITDKQQKAHETLLELYKDVSIHNFSSARTENYLLDNINFTHLEIPSLQSVYKERFSKEEWAKICYFEWHFSHYVSEHGSLKEKIEFFEQCATASKIGNFVSGQCVTSQISCQDRRDAAESLNYMTVRVGEVVHSLISLDEDLMKFLKTEYNVSCRVACVNCLEGYCHHGVGVHVYLENTTNEEFDRPFMENIAVLCRTFMRDQHTIHSPEIIMFQKGCFQKHCCAQCESMNKVHRFELRDLLIHRKLGDYILHVSNDTDCDLSTQNLETLPLSDGNYCLNCFNQKQSSLKNPLHLHELNIAKEWILTVPLPFQVILTEVCINISSLHKANDCLQFILGKLFRLFGIFEIALNTRNKNYSGLIQELNTKELIVNYHSASTVFSIASQAGISQSLSSAERWLQCEADTDRCYYNTYIKQYPLLYTDAHGSAPEVHFQNMQQCFNILFMDNLVRLTIHEDPNPGDNRTSQLCTLPLTVKGLPLDSAVASNWHEDDCLEELNCDCRKRTVLSKDDIFRLTGLNAPEKKMHNLLSVQAVWGLCNIWHLIMKWPDQALKRMLNKYSTDDTGVAGDIQSELEELNVTLQSVHLGGEEQTTADEDENDPFIDNKHKLHVPHVHEEGATVAADEHDFTEDGDDTETESENVITDVEDDFETAAAAAAAADFNDVADIAADDTDDVDDDDSDDDETDDDDGDDAVDDISDDDTEPVIDACTAEILSLWPASPIDNMSDDNGLESPSTSNSRSPSVPNEISTSLQITAIENFQFSTFKVPPLLCRHPTPATGRDDDKNKLREILKDVLVKLGRIPVNNRTDRILFAPDYKIAKNLFQLQLEDSIFQMFLAEFPLLHLKKSKVNNLTSAYKEAGIVHLLMYMKDEEREKEISELTAIHNIEAAARNIRRLAIALHVAFMVRFSQTLNETDSQQLQDDIASQGIEYLTAHWGDRYNRFLHDGSVANATFALHRDMMTHADEVVAISIAERIGGVDGYNLLLSVVKSSLPFSFLNGASSYASFCVYLLHEHFSAGKFHCSMKASLFSTPHKESTVNFALDTQREMDHKDAIKGFRPRSTMQSVVSRMSVIDTFTDVRDIRDKIKPDDSSNVSKQDSFLSEVDNTRERSLFLNSATSETDLMHALPTATLILRLNALSVSPDTVPYNIYAMPKKPLSPVMLDRNSYPAGVYLAEKHAYRENLFGTNSDEMPKLTDLEVPQSLLRKLKSSKGVTIQRSSCKSLPSMQPAEEKKENCRQKLVKRKTKDLDCMSSEMNAVQALVNPNCSKPTVQKSQGISKGLIKLLSTCFPETPDSEVKSLLEKKDLLYLGLKEIPSEISRSVKAATIEFAGVKFKTSATSGSLYIQHVEAKVIKPLLKTFPNMKHIVVCEEKYSFTPDDFKGPTRDKRTKRKSLSVVHLKTGDKIISRDSLSKGAVVTTTEGKRLISNYLAENICQLQLSQQFTVDVDSELVMTKCVCSVTPCICQSYATPIRACFSAAGFQESTLLHNIKQRKGEAEMSQVDWLPTLSQDLEEGETIISVVSSADIDSIVIHMFALSIHWARNSDGTFKHQVYILLQKAKSDLFNITAIIEQIESKFEFPLSAASAAIALCLGGNDYILRYSGMSHVRWISAVLQLQNGLQHLVQYVINDDGEPTGGNINKAIYVDLVKRLYCPKNIDPSKVSLDVVRQMSVKMSNQKDKSPKSPKSWMPPLSAIEQVAKLVDCQIEYLLTAGTPHAALPDFAKYQVLKRNSKGHIKYNLGPDVYVEKVDKLLSMPDSDLQVVIKNAKFPTRPNSKKRNLEVTPGRAESGRKRKPKMSTPIKSRRPLFREDDAK